MALTFVGLILLALLGLGVSLYHSERSVYIELLAENLARAAAVAGEEFGEARDAETLAILVRKVADLTGTRVTLIAHSGLVLADSQADPARMENHAGRPEVRTAILGGKGVAIRSSPTLGEEMLYIAVPAGDGMVARLAVPMTAVREAVNRLRYATLLPLAAVGVLGVALVLGLTRRMTEPLREMSGVAREMAAGNLEVRAPLEGPVEVAELGQTLNLLAANLSERMAEVDASRERLETLVAGLPAGVVEIDRDYRVVMANPAAERILGFRLDQVRGRHYSALVRSYGLAQAVRTVFERGQSQKLEVELGEDPDQAVHVSVSPLRHPSGGAFGAVLVLEDLGQTRRDARMRRDLVANVSHELKTPVASIRALAETLAAGAAGDPAASTRFLAHIQRESERLARLVDDLLELARLEAEEVSMERAVIDPVRPVVRAVERFAPLMERRGLALSLEVCGREVGPPGWRGWSEAGDADRLDSGLRVAGDERYLERAVANLLDNAMKFTPEGGSVRVSVTRHEGGSRDEGSGRVEIAVTDTGPGLNPEVIPLVFGRFYRADPGRARQGGGGTGLGLAIVKHIVQHHGGLVGAASEGPGRGARFWFILPLDD